MTEKPMFSLGDEIDYHRLTVEEEYKQAVQKVLAQAFPQLNLADQEKKRKRRQRLENVIRNITAKEEIEKDNQQN